MNKNIYIIGTLALCAAAFTACDDDEEYDFPGDARTLVYERGGQASYSALVSPILTSSGVDHKVFANANKPAKGDIHVSYMVDNSLIDTYNTENNTSYLPVPEDVIVVENNELVIKSGNMQSSESFNIKLDESKLDQLDTDAQYIIPVRLVECSGGGSAVSANTNFPSYITISISTDVILNTGDTTGAGTEVTDFSGWTATSSTGDDVSAILDGDKNNYCSVESDDPFDVTIDMGKEYSFGAIKGMYYMSYGGSWGWDNGSFPEGMTVSVSSNGSDWLELGENSNYDATNIVFAGTITARYIKLGFKPSESWWGTQPAKFECGIFSIFAK